MYLIFSKVSSKVVRTSVSILASKDQEMSKNIDIMSAPIF
jgi:hypothetical protein